MICTDVPAPIYFLFSDSVPPLLYYSHIPTMLIVLGIGIVVFLNDKTMRGFSLAGLGLMFILWVFFNLVLWTSVDPNIITFVFSLYGIIQPLLFVFAALFVMSYLNKGYLSFWTKLIFAVSLLPLIIFTHLNTSSFNLPYCEAVEGTGWYYYYAYFYMLLVVLFTIGYGVVKYIREQTNFRHQIILLLSGVSFFLLSFFTTSFLASYLSNHGYPNAYQIEFYGLFAMTIFMGMLSYLIVKYKAFNIKLLATQALIVALVAVVGSMFFFAESGTNTILIAVSLVLVAFGGMLLVRSVKKEVKQREEIEKLAVDLQRANERLKVLDKMKSEFVSIASHQLRSPITSIRGYISMLLEGTYGNFPDKARDILQNISDSSKYMASSIEDYLNVSRIEAGNMKYEYSDFSLKEQAEKVSDELRQVAMKKGLVLVFRSDCTGTGMIHADIGKVRQVMMNLIDNSIKYTPKGTITVIAHDDIKKKKMYVTIQDTGIGMDKDTLEEVFDKFVRAKNANEVNVTGTGLGLFVAKKMVVQMKGSVWAESDGEGKGSTFHIEFPLVPGKANPNK